MFERALQTGATSHSAGKRGFPPRRSTLKIRQYTAPTMQEAILKIKVDLGPTAVILHTRKFKRGGFMGFFAQDMVEVLAAIDPGDKEKGQDKGQDPTPQKAPAPRAAAAPAPLPEGLDLGPLAAAGRPSAPASGPAREQREAAAMARELLAAAGLTARVPASEDVVIPAGPRYQEGVEPPARRATATAVEDAPAPAQARPAMAQPAAVTMMPEGGKLADEVGELKATVTDLKSMMATLVGQLEMTPRSTQQFPTLLQRVYDKLLALDVDASIARGLVVYLQREQPHLKTFEDLCDALEVPVAGLVGVSGPIVTEAGERKIVALVGPTGVGKTTTIAKLAANFALSRNVDMALLTIDTYRVAAIEQLKTYGDIIGLPVEVVLTPQSLKEALKVHVDKGLIMIDTAGRSPYNRLHINELRSFLDVEPRVETHLVLSASTRLQDLKQIVKNFASTGVDRLIFSKTDETDIVGGVISIAHETGLPVSYVTTGQSVPDDIMVAEGQALSRMLVQQLKG